MELRQVRTFRAVAEELSFSRAAAKLGYVQSSVSAQVGALEQELGVSLFVRQKRQLVLTSEGEALKHYAESMIAIAREAERVANGKWPRDDNPLVNAPHPAADVLADEWKHPYSRKEAAFPAGDEDRTAKYWPPVSRIDNVAGDRNLVCSCPPIEALAS
jgi:DNA-binding transcriptional LysR family regulator